MRVGIVAPEFPPEIGGMQTYAYEFARELARRGHEVLVFTRHHVEGEVEAPGLTVHAVLISRRKADWEALFKVQVDLWHVMNASYAWLALETAPVVISVHGNDFLQPYIPLEQPNLGRWFGLWRSRKWVPALEKKLGAWLLRRLVRKALPAAHHIIANSQYTEQTLLRHYPDCAGKTSAGMVGVAQAYLDIEPQRLASADGRLITVCRLSEARKNVDLVLRALAPLKERYRYSYTVVGDGALRDNLEALAHSLGLADRVHFTGFVSAARLKELLAASDLFVLTSSVIPGSHEGFGIAYLEANACGVPVLAARLAGAVEAVKEGVSGMFVDDPGVPDIAQALEHFLSGQIKFDPRACQAFAGEFAWAKVVDHALKYYMGTSKNSKF